jgi:hypothetical protein
MAGLVRMPMRRTHTPLLLLSLALFTCAGPEELGEPCDSDDDCPSGAFCAPGGCQSMCRDDVDCLGSATPTVCDERGRCVEPVRCARGADCQNELFCDGEESCDPSDPEADLRGCVAAGEPSCVAGQSCLEGTEECVTDCSVSGDADGDGHDAPECGGDDCDDSDDRRFTGNSEVCDADDVDEDCDPRTFGSRDGDGDGFVDALCCNVDPAGARRCGDDCDDGANVVRPGGTESCNGVDEDCDGTVDDGPDALASCTAPPNATPVCAGGACGFNCLGGYHACGGVCESDFSVNTCGTSCTPCVPPVGGTATCDGSACGFTCNTGYHPCNGTCAINSAVATCGLRCNDPCVPPANGTATCDGSACGFTCSSGYHACNGACASNSDVATCGASSCDSPCPDPTNGSPTCNGTACGIACDSNYHLCSGACVSNFDVRSCGLTSCGACVPPSNASSTCNGVSCGFECLPNFHLCGGACVSNFDNATCGTSCSPCAAHLRCDGTAACTLGTWHSSAIIWSNATTMRAQYATSTFNASNGYSYAYRQSDGATGSPSGSFTVAGDLGITASHPGIALQGQLSLRGDVLTLLDTQEVLRYHGIWIRKSSGHSVGNLTGDWHEVSFFDGSGGVAGGATAVSGFGNVNFTSAGAMTRAITRSDGASDASTGTASVGADGAVTIARTGGGVFRGQINPYNDVMILTFDPDTDETNGFRPGHHFLVRKSSSRSVANVGGGTYFLNHMAGTNRSVWGEATILGAGTSFSGGWLETSDPGSAGICNGGSIAVGAGGNIDVTLINGTGCALTGMITGWIEIPNGASSDVLVMRNANATAASLQIWIRKP